MSRYLRFHAIAQTQNLGIMTAILSLVFLAGQFFPESTLVSAYYEVVPFMIIMLSLVVASATATSQLTMVISMGGTRQAYFWSLQPIPLIYTLYGVAIATLFHNFAPANLGFILNNQLDILAVGLAIYVAFYLGTATGILTTKHPLWGIATIVLLCGGGGAWMSYRSIRFISTPATSLSPVAFAIAAVAVLLWNIYLKRYIGRFNI